MADTWPEWATLTDIGGGRHRLDLDGTLNGTRMLGHAIGSLEGMRKLVAALTAFEAAHESVAALIARAGLPGDDAISALPGLTWHVTQPLNQEGIATIGDLVDQTDAQLLDVPNFGERRLEALKAALREAS
ncbi:DNA-directed RNA polymerase subunit alpha C-terminal domain-containing protein [Nonomuraea sp. NPDC050404]|uniref:DNA-directed RNA polymerase subunit alpha C-terminal domain-containing protein n=1 Tax=Nonomuraea sp. NPDC050404 TaxID=3155783 RepID=UPI003405F86D